MKLNWFTPLPPARSGIAEYSAMLAPTLASQSDVTFWSHSPDWDSSLEQHYKCATHQLGLSWNEVNASDASVFHIGNNATFHGAMWQLTQLHSGIVVLHDLCLQDLFYGILTARPSGGEQYIEFMQRLYGAEAGNAARRVLDGMHLHVISPQYPMYEAVLHNAFGVVVHTPEAFATLHGKCQAALAYLPLPYRAASPDLFSRWEVRRRKPPKPPYKVVVIGFLGGNRRIESVLHVLAELPAKQDFQLQLYGSVWNEQYVREQIKAHQLESIVTINGFVPDLDDSMADADLAINLRFPTMGEASLSQLQIWDHALPSIVTRTGWYATLSEEAVLFVDLKNEMEDLARHLTAFAAAPEAFARMGENGRAILLRDHSPDRYTHNLLQFVEEALLYRPALTFRKTAQRMNQDLQSWTNPTILGRTAESIAGRISHFLR